MIAFDIPCWVQNEYAFVTSTPLLSCDSSMTSCIEWSCMVYFSWSEIAELSEASRRVVDIWLSIIIFSYALLRACELTLSLKWWIKYFFAHFIKCSLNSGNVIITSSISFWDDQDLFCSYYFLTFTTTIITEPFSSLQSNSQPQVSLTALH